MGKVLLLEDRSNLRFLYSLNLKAYTSTEIVHAVNREMAENELEKGHDEIGLIITRSKIDDIPVGKQLLLFMEVHHYQVPIIVLGEIEGGGSHTPIILSETPEIKELVQKSAQCLGITAKIMATKEVPLYTDFEVESLLPLNFAICDIFILQENEYKIVFHQSDSIHNGHVRALMGQNNKFIYIRSNERLMFVNMYTQAIQRELNKTVEKISDRITQTNNIYKIASETLSEIGITDESINLIDASISSIKKIMEGNETLSNLSNLFLKENFSFRYKHCQLITMLSHKIIDEMEWGDQEQKDKLTFAAFIHDIVLQNDVECKIHSIEELERTTLPPEANHRVMNHARLAAAHIKSYPKAPSGVLDIVELHHGDKGGVGFSDNFIKISPLTAIFIVAEDLALSMLKTEEKKEKFHWGNALQSVTQKYDRPAFRKTLLILENVIEKMKE